MKYPSSTFFFQFSLRDLVANCRLLLPPSIAGSDATASGVGGVSSHWSTRLRSGGGIRGGVGAIAGGISEASGQAQRTAHKYDSVSFEIESPGDQPFDETALIESVRAGLEAEVGASGATVGIHYTFGPAKFGIEYEGDQLYGRICISGRRQGTRRYSLHATIEEIGESASLPDWEAMTGRHQLESNYYACAFRDHDDQQKRFETFNRRIQESVARLRQRIPQTDPNKRRSLTETLEYAVVYVWSPAARQMMTMMGREYQVPSRYNLDRAVYFLNETALKMFRESGDDIEVLETISADEFSDFNLPGPQLRGPYIPKE